MDKNFEYLTKSFVVPSGCTYTIREENGEDEEIISNPVDAKGLMNLTKFIAAIVVDQDFLTHNGHMSIEEVLDIPLLDRYAILFQSRMFSLGNLVPFNYLWFGDSSPIYYEQDITEMLYDDYSKEIPEEEVKAKPDAIPVYPDQDLLRSINFKDYELNLTSGKKVKFDLLNGRIEKYIISLPEDKQTRNSELIARNLCLEVNGVWEKVSHFRLFSVRDMSEIRECIRKIDPLFTGTTEIAHPTKGITDRYAIMTAPRFFFLTEA